MRRNFRKLNVLVTGGNGFIGSHLVHELVDLGAKVSCLVKPGSDIWRISGVKNKVNLLRYDICDRKLKPVIKKINPDKVFHLASLAKPQRDITLTEEMFRVNVNGTLNLMSILKDLNCEAIVNTGTCEEYGDSKAPFKESDLPRPVSPYSASKVSSTFYCQMLYGSFRMPIVTLRPFLRYGPKQSGGLFIPSLIMAVLEAKDFEMTKGGQTREFNYVSDIVDGFLRAGSTMRAVGKIINIGCGDDYRIKDIAKKIISIIGVPVKLKVGKLPYREGEVKRFYCSNTLARKILGWRPKVGLDDGLRRTIEWYRKKMYSD